MEKTLKALANRRRLLILKSLKQNREASVAEIASEISLSFKATSKHLGILSGADIIEREQRGLQMFYRLSRDQESAVKHIISLL
ncbi:MAG: winged helix-turn-helix transcriptional regulator [Ignavibacteriae bacterium]|nr:winged helix-turn-helix transcriptional regulator [Ignavibacteriota bacterium]